MYSSPAIGPDGTVYIGCGTKLYALYATNNLQNSSSSWPMFRREARHHGRSIQRGIRSPSVTGGGDFAMTLLTETGRTYAVEASTNLISWAPLTNFTANTLTNVFLDAGAAASLGRRYYRLRTP